VANIKLFSSRSKKRKHRTAGKTALIILVIIIVGLLALVLSLGFYVSSLDTVFPNVWADGIKLSGMTLQEATEALITEGYESNAEDVSATVSFPDGESFTIYGDDVGFSLNAEEAALAAFEFGRGGSFFENEITFLRAYFNRTDLRDVSKANFDDTIVLEMVAFHTKKFNDALIDGAYDINDHSIVIVVGTGIMPAKEESVYDLTVLTLFKAFEEQAHLSAQYVPTASTDNDVDLHALLNYISVEPVSAEYDRATFSATQSSPGRTFDMEKAQTMLDRAAEGERVVIPLLTVPPERTTEELDELLFRDVIAEGSTRITGSSNRVNNINIASEAIHETLLNPGDVFSFNEVVGQRTAARGYREAGAYVSGMLVDEVGGGICQVSSTIYYCVLRTSLEVVERRPHGMTVAYLPLGQDATVSWGSKDFRFKNNTDYPIRIEAIVQSGNITVKLIGTKLDDTYIEIDHVTLEVTPIQVIRREDESVPQGQTKVFTEGMTGYIVEVFKSLFDGEGNLIERWSIGKSTYNVQDRVILIPPELPPETDPPPTDEPPTDEPPTDEPPTDEPPTDEPPTDEPPTDEPPTDEPPTDEPPTDEPPVDPSDEPPDP